MARSSRLMQHQNLENGHCASTPPRHLRSDSKMSIHESLQRYPPSPSSRTSADLSIRPAAPKTQSYMDSLVPPSKEDFERIAQIQEQKEKELRQRDRHIRQQSIEQHKQQQDALEDNNATRAKAARLIQKTFRGHRTRRELDGFGIDASTRWISALREAEFRETNRPRSRGDQMLMPSVDGGEGTHRQISNAKMRWKKASIVARRAGHDDLESDSSSISTIDSRASEGERERIRSKSQKTLDGRRDQAKMMGLQYFLEMVDLKHRYGSNLRTYHAEWKKADTKENFFYWLDYGEGKDIEVDSCPRDRLEREKIRYLSREERQYYLVRIDDDGRLRWVKNGILVDTNQQFKDSVNGIVPVDDPTPAFDPETVPRSSSPIVASSSGSMTSLSSIDSTREADRAAKYTNPAPEDPEPNKFKRVTHISASTVWNKLLRRSVRDGTWIFVADTAFRLYIGIKNSGAFQHSSFLQGSRISAAGLIKVKNGRITSLSPLSGHYRPPTSNFRAFVKSLKEGGVDMSRVSISKSYAILVGLEAYVKTRKKSKKLIEDMKHHKTKITDPEEAAKKEEAAKDTSQSAAREREVIEKEEEEREANRAAVKVISKLRSVPREPQEPPTASEETKAETALASPGTVGGAHVEV